MKLLKAIRQKCLDCCCYQQSEVANCTVEKCSLHPFRMGKNPFRQKRVLSDEQKEVMRARLGAARKAREAKA